MSITRRSFIGTAGFAGAGAALAASPAGAAMPSAGAMINAHDLGVAANTGTDQTASLMEALREARSNGATLYVPAGRYGVQTLELDAPVHLAGLSGASVLEPVGGGPALRIAGTDTVSLTGITIDGSQMAPEADRLLALAQVPHVHLADCRLLNCPGTALALDTVGGLVERCEIAGAKKAGIFSIDATGLRITGNHVRDCDNNGILVWRSEEGEDGTIVSDNRIERIGAADGGSGQNGNGINIFRAGNVIAARNRITDCAFTAVRSNAGSACQITGNSCARLGEVALYAEFGFEGAIITDNIVETSASGISITNFNEGGRLAVCANNIVRDLFVREGEVDQRGVGISAEADTLIDGNVIENAPRCGIGLGWGHFMRDVSATGNIIRNCGMGIGVSVSEGAGSAIIANNLVSGAVQGALLGFDWEKLVTGDFARDGVDVPPNVTSTGNRAT